MNELCAGEKSQLFSRNPYVKLAFDFNVKRNLSFCTLSCICSLLYSHRQPSSGFLFFFFHLESVAKIIWGHAVLPHKDSKGCLLFIDLPQLSGVASTSHATFPSSNLPLCSPLHRSPTRLVIPQSTTCLPAFGHVLFSEWEELSLYLAYLNSAHPHKSLLIYGEFLSPTPGNEWLSYLYSTRWLSFCFLLGQQQIFFFSPRIVSYFIYSFHKHLASLCVGRCARCCRYSNQSPPHKGLGVCFCGTCDLIIQLSMQINCDDGDIVTVQSTQRIVQTA